VRRDAETGTPPTWASAVGIVRHLFPPPPTGTSTSLARPSASTKAPSSPRRCAARPIVSGRGEAEGREPEVAVQGQSQVVDALNLRRRPGGHGRPGVAVPGDRYGDLSEEAVSGQHLQPHLTEPAAVPHLCLEAGGAGQVREKNSRVAVRGGSAVATASPAVRVATVGVTFT
jgi:hypothetical protein